MAGNRWGRAVGAGVLEEIIVVLAIIASGIVSKRILHLDADKLMLVAHSQWIPGTVGPIAMFLLTRWALRPLSSKHMAHALVVAATALVLQTLLDSGGVAEGHIALWASVLAGLLKVAAAVAVATVAGRSAPPASPPA